MAVVRIVQVLMLRHVKSKFMRRMSSRTKFSWTANNKSSMFVIPLHHVFLKMVSIVKEETANSICDILRENVIHDDTPVLEFRAGHGYLTTKLLEAGIKNLYVFEKRTEFQDRLKEVVSQYPGRVLLQQRTFNEVFFNEDCLPLYNSPFLETSLPFKCVKKPWDDSPSLKIIGTHSNGKVLTVVLSHLCKNMMYLGIGRPQLIMSLPASSWVALKSRPREVSYHNFHSGGVLFPDFFDLELLGISPPPIHYCIGRKVGVAKEEFATISITPRKDLEKCVTPTLLEEYLFFGTQTMNGKAKHAYVIPTLEKWLPGSGKELVLNDVNCFTQFVDLSAEETLRIFKIWRCSPNFKSSIFMYEFKDYIQYNDY